MIRLSQQEIAIISSAFKKHFDKADHLWLFGSRVYPEKRGGDIDLYIETKMNDKLSLEKKSAFVSELWQKLGEQKIDVVINTLSEKFELPIYHSARSEGVQLV